MAVIDRQSKFLNLIGKGINPNAPNRGFSWIQNMEKIEESWTTRPGFGTIAVIDSDMTTGREVVVGNNTYPIGFQRHLGSYVIGDTGFGHKQIVSVFRTNAYTTDHILSEGGVTNDNYEKLAQYRTLYTAVVYDLTSDDYVQVPLHYHTSQDDALIPDRHATFETVRGEKYESDFQEWVDAGQNEQGPNREFNTDRDEYFWFAETKDTAGRVYVVFGNARAGAWVYAVTDARNDQKSWRGRRMSVNGLYTQDYKEPYGETSCIQPLGIRDGIFAADGTTYLTQDDFGLPQAACVLDRRMVYAVDNVLYFSDPEDLNAIVDANVQGFPTRITAVAETLGNLIVWTDDDKAYYYNPAQGDLISGGTTRLMSDTIGCLGPNAWVNVDGAIIWVAKNGIYRNYGNTSAQRISDVMQNFFEGSISNPLLNYYTSNGATTGEDPQPRSFFEWNADAYVGVNCEFEATHNQILITIPNLLLTFVIEDGGFHIWNYESVVSDDGAIEPQPIVKAVRNMPRPWLLATDGDIYMVTDVREQTLEDTTRVDEIATGYNNPSASYALLRLGRGGGLDASMANDYEDRRILTGEWRNTGFNEDIINNVRDRAWYFINKPITIPNGYNFNWAGISVGAADYSPMWVPIELVTNYNDVGVAPAGAISVTSWVLEFSFDNTHWEPYINQVAINPYEVVFDLPPERLGAVGAYFLGNADDVAQQGVWCWDSGTGLPSPTGDTIKIHIDGAAATHVSAPEFDFIPRYRNPVILLPFKRKAGVGATVDTFSLGISPLVATHTTARQPNRPVQVAVWDDQTRAMRVAQNTPTVQSVDWVYTAEEQSSDQQGFMMVARGINTDIQHSGNANLQAGDPGVASWPLRLFNVITSTNYKAYAAQFLDFLTDPTGLIKVGKEMLRNRMGTSATQTKATFNTTATWGDFTNTATGNFLIGDAQYDNMKTSVGVKGDRIVVQSFGHVLSPAERVRIGAMSVLVRMIPGMRRRGR